MTKPSEDYFRTDMHGFGAAAIAGFESFALNMRYTGRTTRLLDAVKDGDLIIVGTAQTLRHYERELDKRKKSGVSLLYVDIQSPKTDLEHEIRGRAPRGKDKPGRVYFDHGFAEIFTRKILTHAATRMSCLEQLYSSTDEQFEQHQRDRELQARYSYGDRYVR